MPLGLAEFCRQKCLHKIPSYFRAYSAAAHAKDVHMIILNSLPG